ncbi:hypothetical protein ABEX78_32275 [Priestia megaterium]
MTDIELANEIDIEMKTLRKTKWSVEVNRYARNRIRELDELKQFEMNAAFGTDLVVKHTLLTLLKRKHNALLGIKEEERKARYKPRKDRGSTREHYNYKTK